MRNSLLSASILLVTTLAFHPTASAVEEFSYTYVEAGYLDIDDPNGDALQLRGSYGFTDLIHAFFGYTDGDFDGGGDVSVVDLGFGFDWALSPTMDFVGTVAYLNQDINNDDEDGFGLSARVRVRAFVPRLELEGGLNYVDLSGLDSDTSLDLGARYFLTPVFAVGAMVNLNDGDKNIALQARYNFAP
jgi:hypothetical protein